MVELFLIKARKVKPSGLLNTLTYLYKYVIISDGKLVTTDLMALEVDGRKPCKTTSWERTRCLIDSDTTLKKEKKMKNSDLLHGLGLLFTNQWTDKNPEFRNFNKGAEMCRSDVYHYRTCVVIWVGLIVIGVVVAILDAQNQLPLIVTTTSLSLIFLAISIAIKPGTTTFEVAKEWKVVRSRIKKIDLIPHIRISLEENDIPGHQAEGANLSNALRPAINWKYEEYERGIDSAQAEGFPRKAKHHRKMMAEAMKISEDFGLNMSFRHTEVMLMIID